MHLRSVASPGLTVTISFCRTCQGRLGIDIDCDDPTHEHVVLTRLVRDARTNGHAGQSEEVEGARAVALVRDATDDRTAARQTAVARTAALAQIALREAALDRFDTEAERLFAVVNASLAERRTAYEAEHGPVDDDTAVCLFDRPVVCIQHARFIPCRVCLYDTPAEVPYSDDDQAVALVRARQTRH